MKIICAALQLKAKDSAVEKYPHITKDSFLLACCRHADGYKFLREVMNVSYPDFDVKEGFLTSRNTFVDRKEAYELLKDDLPEEIVNIKHVNNSKILYSEDLY